MKNKSKKLKSYSFFKQDKGFRFDKRGFVPDDNVDKYYYNPLTNEFKAQQDRHLDHIKIGDTVKVYDGSYNRDTRTGIHRRGIDPLFQYNNAEVLNTEIKNKWTVYKIDDEMYVINRLDLLLKFERGITVYCSSLCVILV